MLEIGKYADSKPYYQLNLPDGWAVRIYKEVFEEVVQERSKLLNETLEASQAWLQQPGCWIPYLQDPQSGVWICQI